MTLQALFPKKPVQLLASVLTVLAFSINVAFSAEPAPSFPQPGPEHQWLQQLVGEWDAETEAVMEPGQPPVKSKGTESVRMLGGFWAINEVKGMMMDQPMNGIFTVGYDAAKKKYVATWVDSITGQPWNYEGTLDTTGKILTFETEGECPMNPGKPMKFKETVEIKDKNHKVFTSAIKGDDGQWVTMMTSRATRKQQ